MERRACKGPQTSGID